METHASYHSPNLVTVVIAAIGVVMGIVALQESLSVPSGVSAKPPQAAAGIESATVAACRLCGVVESVRPLELHATPGVTIRGLGDDLMSVIGVVAAVLTGNRLEQPAARSALNEVTVRFEDGSTRAVTTYGGRKWERGDRVKVVQGRIHAMVSGLPEGATLATSVP
jgi:hypothetical protein